MIHETRPCPVCKTVGKLTFISEEETTMCPWPHYSVIPIVETLYQCEGCGIKVKARRFADFKPPEEEQSCLRLNRLP